MTELTFKQRYSTKNKETCEIGGQALDSHPWKSYACHNKGVKYMSLQLHDCYSCVNVFTTFALANLSEKRITWYNTVSGRNWVSPAVKDLFNEWISNFFHLCKTQHVVQSNCTEISFGAMFICRVLCLQKYCWKICCPNLINGGIRLLLGAIYRA